MRSRWPTLWEASRTLGWACLRNILLKRNILWCWDEAWPLIQINSSLGHRRPLFCYCVCIRVQMGNNEKKLTPLKFDKREKILWLVDVGSLDMVDLAIVNSQITNNESPQIFIFVILYSIIICRPFHKSKKWVRLLVALPIDMICQPPTSSLTLSQLLPCHSLSFSPYLSLYLFLLPSSLSLSKSISLSFSLLSILSLPSLLSLSLPAPSIYHPPPISLSLSQIFSLSPS